MQNLFEAGGQHPPLACRPSPPQGGRSNITNAFAYYQRCRDGRASKLPISPLAGEMPGRAEGDVKDRDGQFLPQHDDGAATVAQCP
ncbi:MAG: hypothetical protein EOS27_31415 [Mesorhizobium sp.]|nr:MAG: hypothetical protein EOS27_31415 [Mesorhizobium sp.]